MTAEDVLLLANGCDPDALREAISQASKSRVSVSVADRSSLLGSWSLCMRYAWPDSKWKNNIHTDVYAQSLGYKRGLVEGPGVADVVYMLNGVRIGVPQKFKLSWKYLAPLYDGTAVALVSAQQSDTGVRRFSICEIPVQYPATCRVLLEIELEAPL